MRLISLLTIPIMIFGFILIGMIKRVKVYDCFVEGAGEALSGVIKIIPPLVGLMVAISMLRESGAIELLGKALQPILKGINFPQEVLPLAILRPLSGSGATAIVTDIFKNSGPDSIGGKIASVMMGSTETTFYTIAVYFGAVGINNTRHTLKGALSADFTGIILSVIVTNLLLI